MKHYVLGLTIFFVFSLSPGYSLPVATHFDIPEDICDSIDEGVQHKTTVVNVGSTSITESNQLASLQTSSDSLMNTVAIFFDKEESSIAFAVEELAKIYHTRGISISKNDIDELITKPKGLRIIICKSENSGILNQLTADGAKPVSELKEQDYAIRVTTVDKTPTYWVIGGSRIGAMYGGLDLAENIAANQEKYLKDADHHPYIKKRGIKFNIPLDVRSPSHDDRGTAAQTNIVHMWDFNFWKTYLDELAKTRYNVLSLWNQHPFPSMIKMEEYPEIALNDVYNATGKVKEMSIDDKILLWKKIMEYADNRGIEVSIMTWNIHMNGIDGKYGITEDFTNPKTIAYLRKAVKQLFITYPKLAGIGVTAGENMFDLNREEKEQWMWKTYGKGVQDVKLLQPDRHIRFIHRYWMTAFDNISSRFGQLTDGYDMSFNYIRAHIYSAYDPPFAEKELLPILPKGIKSWWNLRNDDLYNLRWGDPEYVKQFILHLPDSSRTAGYYIGSDRYAWGRESISKNPTTPRQLENDKHWYSFLLWGRLGYDPNTPPSLFQGLLHYRFPDVSSKDLFEAWKSSSKIVPLVNKFHWFRGDYLFWVEGCMSSGVLKAVDGFHSVRDFISGKTMQDSGIMTIPEYVASVSNKTEQSGMTPIDVSEQLDRFANDTFKKLRGLSAKENIELSETLGDIKAMAY
ncbi:MAG: hypothetical protein WBB27_04065 [Maribacter sp.]